MTAALRELTFDGLRPALERLADPDKAAQMSAYMRNRYHFLGITTPDRRRAARDWLKAAKRAQPGEVLTFAARCWEQDEREFHYVGMEALRARADALGPRDLDAVRTLIATHAWWDTVDGLASRTVGPIVANHQLGAVMDQWIDDSDMWIARTAILHQLTYKHDTDVDRLFRYAELRAADPEFFIRKALGWALRQYAHVNPTAVRTFVDEHRDTLSPLTQREACKHL